MFPFTTRAGDVDEAVKPYLRSIIDMTSPGRSVGNDQRDVIRYNRTLPVVYWPVKARTRRTVDSLRMAFTKDINDQGVGLITAEPIDTDELVLAFMLGEEFMDEPWYFQAEVRQRKKICAGFYQNGLAILHLIEGWRRQSLRKWDDLVTSLLASPSDDIAES